MDDAQSDHEPVDPWASSAGRLMHRWLVEYNPLYLVSAALVLFGVIQISGGLAATASPSAQLAATAIAEAYAWALIGGAALLVRLGRRRPATMLALLAALYQCDLTLHTELCALLGDDGMMGTACWLASFGLKLVALAKAMRLSASLSALAVPMLGAIGLVALPWLTRDLDPHDATTLVMLWLFALGTAGAWTSRRLHARDALGAWPRLVMARATKAIWIGWAAAACLHAGFWFLQAPAGFRGAPWIAVACVLAIRWTKREQRAWILAGSAIAMAILLEPEFTATVATMVAITLTLRAFRRPHDPEVVAIAALARDPYRDAPIDEVVHVPPPSLAPERIAVRNRLLQGALGAAALATWTLGWVGDELPLHDPVLEVLLLAIAIAMTRALRSPVALVWPAASLLHVAAQLDLLPAPQSRLQAGAWSVAAGFALLVLLLGVASGRRRATAWRSQLHREPDLAAGDPRG